MIFCRNTANVVMPVLFLPTFCASGERRYRTECFESGAADTIQRGDWFPEFVLPISSRASLLAKQLDLRFNGNQSHCDAGTKSAIQAGKSKQ